MGRYPERYEDVADRAAEVPMGTRTQLGDQTIGRASAPRANLPNIKSALEEVLCQLSGHREILLAIEEPLGIYQNEKADTDANDPMPSAALDYIMLLVRDLERQHTRIYERLGAIHGKMFG